MSIRLCAQLAIAVALVFTLADNSSAIGRRRRCGRACPASTCATTSCQSSDYCMSYANPCICPRDIAVTYWTGSHYNNLYIADRYNDVCGCEGGPCLGPVTTYLTGTGVAFPQSCSGSAVCSIASRVRESDEISAGRRNVGLVVPVPHDFRPSRIKNDKHPYFAGYFCEPIFVDEMLIEFQPSPGAGMVLAKVMHYVIPAHANHPPADDPDTFPAPVCPPDMADAKNCPPRMIAIGFEADPTGAPRPVHTINYSRDAVIHDPAHGEDFYHVKVGEETYGIVVKHN